MRCSLIVVVVLLAGCSLVNDPNRHTGGIDSGIADSGPPDAGPPRLERGDICMAYAELTCAGIFGCCSAAPRPPSPAQLTQCLTDAQIACANNAVINYTNDPRTGYDPVVGAEVFEQGRRLVESCSTDYLRWWTERSFGMQRSLTGTVEGGADCTPMQFWPPDQADVPALLSCEGTNLACRPGAGGVADRWFCTQRQQAGGRCLVYFDCVDGLYCTEYNLIEQTGTCRARLPNGSPCGGPTDCQSLTCLDPLGGNAKICLQPTADLVYCPR